MRRRNISLTIDEINFQLWYMTVVTMSICLGRSFLRWKYKAVFTVPFMTKEYGPGRGGEDGTKTFNYAILDWEHK